jgi:hypothetical protein
MPPSLQRQLLWSWAWLFVCNHIVRRHGPTERLAFRLCLTRRIWQARISQDETQSHPDPSKFDCGCHIGTPAPYLLDSN